MLCIAVHQYYYRKNNNNISPEVSSNDDDDKNNTNTNNDSSIRSIRSSVTSTVTSTITSTSTMPGVLENALNATKTKAQKTKIRADILLLERKIPSLKKSFGIQLYDELKTMTCSQDFYSTSDTTISTIRPLLLTADREIRALSNKQIQAQSDLDIAIARRAEAFPIPASNWKEKASNAAMATSMMSNETKFKARMILVNSQMNTIKEKFGMESYPILEELFSTMGSGAEQLPVHCATDKDVNTIRFVFQKCRTDIEEITRLKNSKLLQIDSLTTDMSLRRL